MRYPGGKTQKKVWFCSVPLVACCMVAAYWFMVGYFALEDYLVPWKTKWKGELVRGSLVNFGASLLYAIVVAVMTLYYRKLATALTEWGQLTNPKTQFLH